MTGDRTPVLADDTMRPGGFAITDRAISYCDFQRDARIADIGCGLGATVRHLEEKFGLLAAGLDRNPVRLLAARTGTDGRDRPSDPTSNRLIVGDAMDMPFSDSSLDGLLFECSFSRMEPPEAVLSECRRVLKIGGYWICTDLYARRKPAALFNGVVGRFDAREMIVERAKANGFEVCLFEDHTPAVQTMIGQMILDGGIESLYESFGLDREELREIGCGYYLMIAARR